MFKKAVPLLLSAILLGGCTPSPAASVFLKEVPLNSEVKTVSVPDDIRKSLYDLSTELTPDYFKLSEKKNQIFSPLSLWYALGVLREGAVGQTLEEINGIMKLPNGFDSGKTIPDLSDALNFMVASAIAKDQTNGIMLTNGIFFDQRYAQDIKPTYWEKAAEVWGTETAQVDFTQEDVTREIIRKWVSENTETFIDDYKATFATDGTAILNIYNVLYLKDLWTEPFNKLDSEVFHAPTGDVKAPFIGKLGTGVIYHGDEKAQAAAFQGETGIKVWFLLPREGSAPADLIPDLPVLLASGQPSSVNFKAPALDIDGENLSLKELLQTKGYTKLFLDADLDEMLSGSAAVTEIKQKTKLQMDENGFKAAAVTEIGVGKTSAPADDPIEFFVDRPYLLVIEYQGLPLFIAQIQDPTEK